MADSSWFQTDSAGKWKLTEEGKTELRLHLNTVTAKQFQDEFGVTKSATYLWLNGKALSARGRAAVTKLLGRAEATPARGLEAYSIEELVAALKAKGVRDIHFTM